MPVIINGSTGISGTDGSAGTPALQGTDTNTGMFFPAADQIAFAEGGVEAMRLDASGNVMVGTTTPVASNRLTIVGGGVQFSPGTAAQPGVRIQQSSGVCSFTGINNDNNAFNALSFFTGASEAARITSGGHFLVGTTGNPNGSTLNVFGTGPATFENSQSGSAFQIIFRNPNGNVGSVTSNGTSTAFNTSSDYRLKANIAPLADAAARVQALKPCRFNWIVDPTGAQVDGFLAHEAAEVVPEAVTGEKDAVNEDGSIKPQGIDQSKLVPLLTAALQEALTEIAALKARVAALESTP